MPQGNPKPGELYLHFKQKLYQIITIAEHSETREPLVIYQALYGNFRTYARPLAMFISPVDREKYPNVGQRFRFQLVEPEVDVHFGEQGTDKGESHEPDQTAGKNTIAAGQFAREAAAAFGQSAQQDSVETSSQSLDQKDSITAHTPEEKLMAFFDAETMEEKYKILLDMREDITDRMINNMAVALDVVIEEGPLDRRFEELKTCIRTFRKYESSRLR